MSDSENHHSATDDNLNASENSAEESTSKVPVTKQKSKKSKSPKKKSNKKSKKANKAKKAVEKKTEQVVEKKAKEPAANVEEEYEVEEIVGHREYNGKLVYKIRWKNYNPIDDTWETFESLSCPDLLKVYNAKHNVIIPKHLQTKRKSSGGESLKKSKKPRGSVEDKSEDGDDEYEVDRIQEVRKKRDGTREFLVKWKKWSHDYDTWEPEANLSCPDLITKFMQQVESAKNVDLHELRIGRKHTERFTLNTRDSGRRLSKRNNNKQRVKYYDAEGEDK